MWGLNPKEQDRGRCAPYLGAQLSHLNVLAVGYHISVSLWVGCLGQAAQLTAIALWPANSQKSSQSMCTKQAAELRGSLAHSKPGLPLLILLPVQPWQRLPFCLCELCPCRSTEPPFYILSLHLPLLKITSSKGVITPMLLLGKPSVVKQAPVVSRHA